MPTPPPPIRVNRAPVMTLWATVVAEPLGYPPETALTLGRFVAESSARWRHAGGKAISNAGEERTDVTGLYAAPGQGVRAYQRSRSGIQVKPVGSGGSCSPCRIATTCSMGEPAASCAR